MAFVLIAGCAARSNGDVGQSDYHAMHVITRTVVDGPAIRCDAGLYDVTESPPRLLKRRLGPPSFLVADLGKAGVPHPDPNDARLTRRIAQSLDHPSTLRFIYVDKEYLVYDAVDGPCTAAAAAYQVLNDPACNFAYTPGDVEDGRAPVPERPFPKRPWFPNDRGQGSY
jgi:hypothetical protein